MLEDKNSDVLFVNCSGKSMSRQGFWKLIKYYAKKAGIESEITPKELPEDYLQHLYNQFTLCLLPIKEGNFSPAIYFDGMEVYLNGNHQILKVRPGLLPIADPSGKL